MRYSNTFRVGRFTCTMTFDTATMHLTGQWEPDVPGQHSLTRKEVGQYQAGRDALMAQVSHETGLRTLVVEV
jgi:hypothetical protein